MDGTNGRAPDATTTRQPQGEKNKSQAISLRSPARNARSCCVMNLGLQLRAGNQSTSGRRFFRGPLLSLRRPSECDTHTHGGKSDTRRFFVAGSVLAPFFSAQSAIIWRRATSRCVDGGNVAVSSARLYDSSATLCTAAARCATRPPSTPGRALPRSSLVLRAAHCDLIDSLPSPSGERGRAGEKVSLSASH